MVCIADKAMHAYVLCIFSEYDDVRTANQFVNRVYGAAIEH